ncbi:MAG TPA: NB-ARC domain-containing protein [Actinocrinis sp.]|nr:NB-ARC domain-containing protein [Actinospica sp.]HEU5426839.1 NB-ARC domain-containing protein [Actinocrinis sp.]
MAGLSAPDPAQAGDLGEFIEALGRLRLWAGAPSYRTLAKAVGPKLSPPQMLAHTTIGDLFQTRRRRLDLDLVTATVRALGLPESDVARWGAACIRVHAQARTGGPISVLRQLPADLCTFTGRERELRALFAAIAERPGSAQTAMVSAIQGMAGVGKTRLAVHAAHELVRAGRFTDAQLFVNLHGFDPEHPPADPASVLGGFLRQLGVPAQVIPDSVEERSAMYRDRLHGMDALIVLDNAADEKQVRDLIPAAPGCLVLITSRRTMTGLDGAAILRLDVLDPPGSQLLLGRIVDSERLLAQPAATATVAEACGHLPLAVSLAAARLRSRPAWSVTDLLTELRSAGMSAIAAGGRSVADAFDASLARLDAEQHRMFLFLGLCPGKDIGAEAAAIMARTNPENAKALMESLVDEHLALSPAPGRFTLHRVLRGYAAGKAAAGMPEPQRSASLRHVLCWYTARAHDTAAYRPPKARKLLAQAPALADNDRSGLSDAWRAVGRAHLWSEEFEAAENAYWRALRLTPADGNHTAALLGIRQAHRAHGQPSRSTS